MPEGSYSSLRATCLKEDFLLTSDAIINLILGLLLLFLPLGIDEMLGVPVPHNYFYSSILGAVLAGIGIALLIERFRSDKDISGLGLAGAIAINLPGAFILIYWLLFGELHIPLRGFILLWIIALIVLVTGIVELMLKSKSDS